MSPIAASARMAEWLENAWLTRYLDRQLSDDETTWFEAYVLDKPHLLAAIETDTHLRDALGRMQSTQPSTSTVRENNAVGETEPENLDSGSNHDGVSAIAVDPVPANSKSAPRRDNSLHRARARNRLSVAAAFAAGLLIPGIAFIRQQERSASNESLPVLGTVTLGAARGSNPSTIRAILPSGAGLFVIEIPPVAESAPKRSLRARLQSENGQTIVVENLTAATDGYVAFAVPAAKLAPGRWVVTLAGFGSEGAEPLARYTLELSGPP